jgi:hypothetical protein
MGAWQEGQERGVDMGDSVCGVEGQNRLNHNANLTDANPAFALLLRVLAPISEFAL